MKRVVALGCCALYLIFGTLAGLTHVHGAADDQHAAHGARLDHAHLDHAAHHHHAEHDPSTELSLGYSDLYHDDAVYLTQTAVFSATETAIALAILPSDLTTDTPTYRSIRRAPPSHQPRDPPSKTPQRLRAPPA